MKKAYEGASAAIDLVNHQPPETLGYMRNSATRFLTTTQWSHRYAVAEVAQEPAT